VGKEVDRKVDEEVKLECRQLNDILGIKLLVIVL
jgi:hypothetical protein